MKASEIRPGDVLLSFNTGELLYTVTAVKTVVDFDSLRSVHALVEYAEGGLDDRVWSANQDVAITRPKFEHAVSILGGSGYHYATCSCGWHFAFTRSNSAAANAGLDHVRRMMS